MDRDRYRAVVAPSPSPPRWPWVLAIGPALPAVYWFAGRSDAIAALTHDGSWLPVTGPAVGGLVSFLLAFVVLGAVPIALSRPVLCRSPRDLGLGAGRIAEGLRWTAAGIPLAILAGWLGARSPALGAVYPLGDVSLTAASFLPHAVGYLLYYVGFEYHFRGFMLLGLERHLGAWPANLLQAGIVTLVHVGKPPIELAAAYPASLLFGWVALRTRSIWYVVAIHWAAGLALDWFLLTR